MEHEFFAPLGEDKAQALCVLAADLSAAPSRISPAALHGTSPLTWPCVLGARTECVQNCVPVCCRQLGTRRDRQQIGHDHVCRSERRVQGVVHRTSLCLAVRKDQMHPQSRIGTLKRIVAAAVQMCMHTHTNARDTSQVHGKFSRACLCTWQVRWDRADGRSWGPGRSYELASQYTGTYRCGSMGCYHLALAPEQLTVRTF